jgi:hypothetical protein
MPSFFTLPDDLVSAQSGQRFLPLGRRSAIFMGPGQLMSEAVKFRIEGITNGPVNGFWGTLGRADGAAPDWEGDLVCSGEGNEESEGDLSPIIDALRDWQPNEPVYQSEKIIERFINFDDVDFGPSEGSRQLRLTLMLAPWQSAILFYHHGEPGSGSPHGDVEFILPAEGNALGPKPGRRTFFFEVPGFTAAHNDITSHDLPPSRFVVKALVFRHDEEDPLAKLRRFEGYGFKRYSREAEKGFEEISAADIDLGKKTLLLVHGTFASTRASFRGLTERTVEGTPWLQYLLDRQHYEQIIGFDHSTVLDSTFTNVSWFKEQLAAAHGAGWAFTHPVDIVGTSRGGVVVKTICNDEELNGTGRKLVARKVGLVSCANGAALLDEETGVRGIRLLLSLFARIPFAPTKVLFTVLQVAFEVYRRQDGTLSQTHNSELLNRVLNVQPRDPGTRYYPVCGNWEPAGLGWGILDALVDHLLEHDNDGVNYTHRMNLMPANTSAYSHPPAYYLDQVRVANAFHTGYFTTDGETRPETYLHDYLTDGTAAWKG